VAMTSLRPAGRDAQEVQPRGPNLSASRSRRTPLALVALLLAIVSGLAFTLWARDLDHRISVLALTRTVEAGEKVRASDLVTVRVVLGSGTDAVAASDAGKVVGRIATTRLLPGALVVPGAVEKVATLAPGDAIVGVLVKSGESPVGQLSPGARVVVVRTAPASTIDPAPPEVLASDASIFAVRVPGADTSTTPTSGAQLVSLRVPQETAPAIVSAAASERIRLVLISAER
jgi:hypothetical protein